MEGAGYLGLFEANFVESVLQEGGSGPRAVGAFVTHDGVERHGALRVEKEGEAESRGIPATAFGQNDTVGSGPQ